MKTSSLVFNRLKIFHFILLITLSFFANSQVGIQFMNHETSEYSAAMKSQDFTYLVWDRNDDGAGNFTSLSRPMFFYWDNDASVLGFLLDTRNMPYLKAKFNSLALGTSLPSGYQLAVDGKAIMEEVQVEVSSSWPDYVFSKDYPLKSLQEIKAFITKNNHLPNMPSAEQVEEDGIALGEMNALLLEKIEELTLLLIEKDEQYTSDIDELKERIEALEKQNNSQN